MMSIWIFHIELWDSISGARWNLVKILLLNKSLLFNMGLEDLFSFKEIEQLQKKDMSLLIFMACSKKH